MKKQIVFEYLDYKTYIKDSLPTKGSERGGRGKLAEFLNCQSAFISQVLNTNTHFSLEQAKQIDEYLHHNSEESRYFMLLLSSARAGSKNLEQFYLEQIQEIRNARQKVTHRAKGKTISEKDQLIYYSNWYYSAIHLLVLIPKLQTLSALVDFLRVPIGVVKDALDFLLNAGFLSETNGEYQASDSRIHLPSGSPLLIKHHTNWRMKAIEHIGFGNNNDVHYSGCIAISKLNEELVKKKILDLIEQLEPILAEPNEEIAFGICLDFFKLG